MKLVFVNHAHPNVRHVSGTRAWRFARELATRGHHIILMCEAGDVAQSVQEPEDLVEALRSHNWAQPLVVAVKPSPIPAISALRSARTPSLLRKALVSWSFLRYSGVYADYSEGTRPYLPMIARNFQPDIVWGVFLTSDCWLIARRLARLSGCSWVGDMKDSWELFIPKGLRWILARRFRDMAASTANAAFTERSLARWLPPRPTVIYSGVDRCFFDAKPSPLEEGAFRLTITGSIYNADVFSAFISGVVVWLQSRKSCGVRQAEIVYAGAEAERVRPIIEGLNGLARVVIQPYLPLVELAALCRSATVNAYIWTHRTFHHKLLELLACSRPVLTFPGEWEESISLAETCGRKLLVCASSDQLVANLLLLENNKESQVNVAPNMEKYTWSQQAVYLERVFQQTGRSAGA